MTTDDPFLAIAEYLHRTMGLSVSPSRRPFADAAIRRAFEQSGEPDVRRYGERLRSEPEMLDALTREATVGETYFLRNPEQFAFIRKVAVPDILARGSPFSALRVWSAGCATGEEAYSLAILFEELGLADRTDLYATDIVGAAITAARNGVYGEWSFRATTKEWRKRYFTPEGAGHWKICARIHASVEFEVRNLLSSEPLARAQAYDLVMCRNVLMYLDRPAVARVASALATALAPGGWLVTSPTDPVLPEDLGLEVTMSAIGVMYRRPGEIATVPQEAPLLQRTAPPDPPSPPPPLRDRGDAPQATVRPTDAEVHIERALRLLDLVQPREAQVAARSALLLDHTLAVAHFTLGRALRLDGVRTAARRSLRRAHEILTAQPEEEPVRFAGGARAGSLVAATLSELTLLDEAEASG